MKFEISEEKYNKLLCRNEIIYKIQTDGPTPKKESVIDEISKLKKIDKELIIITKIKQQFSKTICYAHVFIYDKKENILKRQKQKKKTEDKKE